MTRYIKQRDQFSCVAIAILNARKWLGHKVSYDRDYMSVRCKAGLIIGVGTGARGFLRAARGLPLTRICKPTYAKIKKAIKAGNAVIVRSRWPQPRGGHIFLITKLTKRSVFCVNVYGGHVWRSRRIFKGYYLYRGAGGPAAWTVEKQPCPSNHKPKQRGSKSTSPASTKSSRRRRLKPPSYRSTRNSPARRTRRKAERNDR